MYVQYQISVSTTAQVVSESYWKDMQGSRQVAEAFSVAGAMVTGMLSLEMLGYACDAPCQIPFFDSLPCVDIGEEGATAGDYIAAVANMGLSRTVE